MNTLSHLAILIASFSNAINGSVFHLFSFVFQKCSTLYPASLIIALPPKSDKSIIATISISSLECSNSHVQKSAVAIAVPPVAIKSSTITTFL